jgi:hypothetical protein
MPHYLSIMGSSYVNHRDSSFLPGLGCQISRLVVFEPTNNKTLLLASRLNNDSVAELSPFQQPWPRQYDQSIIERCNQRERRVGQ